MEKEEGRAAIWELDLKTGKHRIFASGLRNPNGMAWEPDSGALWTVVNERDELGSDLVPDYMTMEKRSAARWGWYWINRGPCWLPTMSATLSGGSRPHFIIAHKG
jgi:glucose/arabinose dehydrogenase